MGRLNKLDTEIELEVVPGNNNNNNLHHNNLNSSSSPSSSSGLSSYGGCNLSSNGYDNSYNTKEYYYGSNKRDLMCSQGESDDSFLRPPLWEDITSSIQNIDPENAIMLSTLTGATQVKLEAVDDAFLEPLSSPLLSPLEIKTEKVQISLLQNVNNNNNLHPHHQHPHHHHNGSNHISNNNNYHNNNNNNSSYQLNGSGYLPPHSTNGMHPSVHIHVQNNNYYTPPPPPPPTQSGWPSNNNSSHGHNPPLSSHNLHNNGSYPPKFSPPPNLCPSQMSRLMYVPPLTPPNSDPGSPINGMQTSRGRSPPPPYHPSQQQGPPSQPQHNQITQLSHNQLTCTPIPMHTNNGHHPNGGGQLNHPHPHSQQQQHHHHHHHPSNHPNQPYSNSNTTSTNNGNNNTSNMSQVNSSHNAISVLSSATVVKAVQRYNRRNNPELEKRRIHHCDFMGCTKVYTKSSHLKAHQRIHTGKSKFMISFS
uniref:CSON008131 protein n=1 Tax=Culicoides sonorensis TaxID=179676 RepID=A0A336LYK9_CULSO